MGAAVIVAIPRQDEAVWKISSEKIPHLTLLYLGEDMAGDRAARIAQFLQHAAKNLGPFGMDVDYRGELGEDRADVLFFKKSWSKEIENFRANLLGNPDIKLAYNSTEQHPKWLPHLTLGYPETPAHPDERENPYLGYISFDRVALWTEDFDGPTFRLEDQYGEAEVPMYHSVDDFLSGYGVKTLAHRELDVVESNRGTAPAWASGGSAKKAGGKGNFDESKVKRDGDGKFSKKESRLSKEDIDKELDAVWLKSATDTKMAVVTAAKAELEDVARVVARKHGIKPADLDYEDPKIWSDAGPKFLKVINETAKRFGVSPSGTKMVQFTYKGNQLVPRIVPHTGPNPNADFARPERRYIRKRESASGGSMRYNPSATLDPTQIEIAHNTLGDFLAHFGIKGMRWGVRKSKPTGPSKDLVKTARELVKKDKNPTDVDSPVHKDDEPYGSGFTNNGTDFQKYMVKGSNVSYIKYSTGEKAVSIDDNGFEWLDVDVNGNSLASASDMAAYKNEEAWQDSMSLGDFLAHYGIKGMRWGVRRTEAQLARLNKKQAKIDQKQEELNKTAVKLGAHKVDMDVTLDKNGNVVSATPAKDAHPSADAVKFVENRLKSPAELSTKEIRDLTDRVKVMQDYEKYFGEGPHAELRREIDRLNLEKDYRQLKAQMASPSKAKVAARTVGNLAKTAGDSFIAFKKLDKATGGVLSKELAVAVGLQTAYKAKHRAAPVSKSKSKKSKKP